MATSTTDKPTVTSSKVVQYIGTADVREIDASGWKDSDIDGKKVVFNKQNRWRVPVEEFNDDQMRYFDEDDADFVVKDLDVPKS